MSNAKPVTGGSSPRGRGKQRIGLQSEEKGGLIPARAGKTLWWTRASRPARAHPRAGGENSRSSQALSPSEGSSPRGRGKLDVGGREDGFGRLIPARAGKTCSRASSASAFAAHPRAGGENALDSRRWSWEKGSSPRGRGKLTRVGYSRHVVRLIPARAGKTHQSSPRRTQCTAHPRAGGENARGHLCWWSRRGSSPRGRGKQRIRLQSEEKAGLIPARAGKTDRLVQDLPPAWAHPRAGGENGMSYRIDWVQFGSSPRGRGKPRPRWHSPPPRGLIPARAGKTTHAVATSSSRRAHPRAGGENTF